MSHRLRVIVQGIEQIVLANGTNFVFEQLRSTLVISHVIAGSIVVLRVTF